MTKAKIAAAQNSSRRTGTDIVIARDLDTLEHRSAGFLLPYERTFDASGDDCQGPARQALAGLCRPPVLGVVHSRRSCGVGPAVRAAGRAARHARGLRLLRRDRPVEA